MVFVYIWMATQIILEMVPVSSSTHLYLLKKLFKKCGIFITIPDVYYFLHIPTLIIVSAYFFKSWLGLFLPGWHLALKPIICVAIVDGITTATFLATQRTKHRFPHSFGLLITAAVLFSTAWCWGARAVVSWTYLDALFLGVAQSIALLSGISRLALTTAAGCWLGFSLPQSFFISWLIYVPLMAAASIKSIGGLYKKHALGKLLNLPYVLVMLISGGISYMVFVIVALMVQENIFFLWGYYLLIPIAVSWWLAVERKGEHSEV